MDKLFKIAIAELGQKEIQGSGNNPAIVGYAHEAGFNWVNDDETPWCSIFVNWVAMKAGLVRSKQANARSWLLVGQNVDSSPLPGDVVVFWRNNPTSWEGHVGIFFGFSYDGAKVYCLGGNQGNQVSISAYPKDTVLGFRRLTATPGMIDIPNVTLRKGDKGKDVKSLQDALKAAGINCGTSDGDFGPLTENAVKQLQSMKYGLTIDGIYEENTRNFLFEVLNR
ncbi:MAG: TIGR02594 family protein [Mangrovibacterium sp.]